jgi:hypothetical protein
MDAIEVTLRCLVENHDGHAGSNEGPAALIATKDPACLLQFDSPQFVV